MKAFICWLSNTNIFFFSIFNCLFFYAVKISTSIIKNIFNLSDIKIREKLIGEDFKIGFDLLVDTLIFAPILETLFFQTFFYFIFQHFKLKKWLMVLISGFAVGLFHNYTLWYMISTMFIGFMFMYLYIIRAEVNNKPYLSTAIAHFTINLVIIITVLIKSIL